MAESITKQMEEILGEYKKEVYRATNDSMDIVAKEAVQKLRADSPKRPGKGQYARGWRVKREKGALGINSVIVHNATNYQLTHLLEYGHIVRNKFGTYGRASAIPHIKPVEEWSQTELPLEIEKELSNI